MIERVPEIVSWYLLVSGIVSVVAWVSARLSATWFDDLASVWVLRWIGYFGWWASLPWGLMMLLLSAGVRRHKKS
ncbi:hypothetical protein ACSNOI_47700, partial [Actinomadura kijaniata]|uniref:hypothetical protein n=1 Tax=Actinomadura kijaniata TaxID=46161 RepID=UPI003F1DE470